MNIFEDYISIFNYNTYDILATYENLFTRLGIRIADFDDNFRSWDWDEDNLQETLKKILLYSAQEEGIIPDDVDIDDFKVNDEFSISTTIDNYKQIIKDFEDWCGIELDTF